MKGTWEDILAGQPELDPQKLLDYLEGKLDDAEKHAVEAMLTDSAFMDDALEGLSQVKDKQKIALILQELNGQLKKNAQSRNRLKLRPTHFPAWLLFSVVTIVLLMVLAFIIYKMLMTPAV